MRKNIFLITFILLILHVNLSADSFKDSLREIDMQIIEEDVNYFDFSLKDIYGKQVNLKDYHGKVIMLNFWATWCPPCRKEMPTMEVLYNKMKGRNFEMLAVNVQEDAETVKNFIVKNKYTFPVLVDPKAEAAARYQARSIPTTYIIDTKGKLAGGFIGAKEWDTKDVIRVLTELTK
ncbi:MAG: TlpA disulfide reductase family protein [Spirochaetia bacterium]|jgi:peroxiredoxin|nr:TlpA disulfide reductase family protein [Spirochaetia bacterium]